MRKSDVFCSSLYVLWILHSVIGEKLIIKAPPTNITANKGDDVRVTCLVEVPNRMSQDEPHIKWKHQGHYIHHHDASEKYSVEDKGQTLLISNIRSNDEGQYSCIATLDKNRDMASGWLYVREPPEAPREVSIMECLGNTVELVWTEGEDGGAPINHYLVQFNTSESPENWKNYYDEIPGDSTSTHVNLSPWGTYSFRLLARNDIGYSKPSNPTRQQCTTPPERPGGNPRDVRTLTHTKGKLIVTWTPMPRLLHNGPGFQYIIFWRQKGSTYWNKNIVENANAQVWEVSVNDTYGLYEIKVKAKNEIGDSRQPAFIYLGHSGEGEPLVIPKDFRQDPIKQVEAHRAHFIWEAVESSEEKILGEFRGYKLRYWKSSEGRHKWKEVDILVIKSDRSRPDVRATIDELPAFTALRAQVSVMNTHHIGLPSQIIDFFTPEGVPDPVRDLRIESYGATHALLKWLPPEEPNGVLLGYDIGYQKLSGDEKSPITALPPHINNPDALGVKISGLSSNHTYRFYVWARTNAGRGEPAYQDVRTKEPLEPKFTPLDTSVNITSPPYVQNGDVRYMIEIRHSGQTHWRLASAEWGRSWVVINDLIPNTEYQVRIIAKNIYGDTASHILYRVKTQQKQGRDPHQYQQDEPPGYNGHTNGASVIHPRIHISLACCRIRTFILQTVFILVIVNLLLH